MGCARDWVWVWALGRLEVSALPKPYQLGLRQARAMSSCASNWRVTLLPVSDKRRRAIQPILSRDPPSLVRLCAGLPACLSLSAVTLAPHLPSINPLPTDDPYQNPSLLAHPTSFPKTTPVDSFLDLRKSFSRWYVRESRRNTVDSGTRTGGWGWDGIGSCGSLGTGGRCPVLAL